MEIEPQESFWKRWFGQRVDPHAGEFTHEVALRSGIGVVAAIAVFVFTNFRISLWAPIDPLLVMLIFLTPEIVVRRTWRIGLFALPFGLLIYFQEISGIRNVGYLMMGGCYGLLAGFGTRFQLAAVPGLIGGSLGGWLAKWGVEYFNDNFNAFLILHAMFVPIYVCVGFSVWLGVKLSKRMNISAVKDTEIFGDGK